MTRTATSAALRDRLEPIAVIAGFLILWQLASVAGWLQPVRFPAPSKLAATLWELVTAGYPEGVTLSTHFAQTMQRILLGFAGAVALALPMGLLIGSNPLLE